ncbi:uncharacterized protein CPUR_03018 [Claviceps purpurea 20.1]|uniref:Retrotransposon gag domain-containing protein n=1 Tax=Claviceps purpurea (strain 20.1) TaxID=1111077 RepID=M1W4I7_CLAP2|nr:uncharacterized protein CPUR_03018 [Claviceps purpurea 20.1]
MFQARVPKLPSMREIGTYDGRIPAERYFRRLGHTLRHLNDGKQVDPSTYISMFELALDGDAAVFAETSFQVRSIMNQASKGVASDKDLDDLQRTFSVRYPPAAEEKKTVIWADIDVRQAEGEDLTGYFNRVLNFYQRAGGQQKSTTSLESLSPPELFMLHQFISKFIRGLHDKTLMQEAVGQRALAASSLQEAHDIVHEAATILESKASLANLSSRDARMSQLEELIRVQNGCSADEMISRTFSPAYPPVSVDSFYAQVQTPIAEFVMDGVAVERRPIPQQPQAFPFVSHQQPLSRAYQEPYRPLQSNQQRYKYNTPANAEACRTPCVEPVLRPVAEQKTQYVVETASLLQEQDFADEPIAHAAPADAAVGACLASVEIAEPSSSPFCPLFQCEGADQRTCLEEVTDDEALLKPSVTSLSRASEVVQESGVQGLTVKKDARALSEIWAFVSKAVITNFLPSEAHEKKVEAIDDVLLGNTKSCSRSRYSE